VKKSLHVSALASAIAVALVSGIAADEVRAQSTAPAAEQRQSYIVEFEEPGLLEAVRENAGDERVSDQSGRAAEALSTVAALSYRGEIARAQDNHLQSIGARLGRAAAPTHRYQVTMSGVALDLSAAEAEAVAQAPGVASVRPAGVEYQQTYRGPTFVGAPSLWSGAAVPPPGVGTRGQNIVIGGIDGGTNSDHPAFANDPACGFGMGNNKVLSSVDCSSTGAGGVCNGANPEDIATGHGVHTISTAAGNTLSPASTPPPTLPPPHAAMSGVAPCAQVRTYKACQTSSCSGADLLASINNAIADGVDVITYSISGGTSPWNDFDRNFLDAVGAGIFVVAAAGNTSATITDPVGQVNHRGPWVVSVANSTHDETFSVPAILSATGPGTPPAATQNIGMTSGSTTPVGAALDDVPVRIGANLRGCTAGGGFPAAFFAGAVALIERGDCNFSEKINNAQGAGALMAVIYNNAAGSISMDTTGVLVPIPSYSILQSSGQALNTFITANGATPTTVDFAPPSQRGDVLNAGSLRGPTPAPLNMLTKPDITAPGTSIYAAGKDPEQYMTMSGTSMATPHVAGGAALLRAIHPTWTPTEVASALMLTAAPAGTLSDAVTPWTPDDVGSGRMDLSKAARAGFVMNESFANFLAANPSTGGNPRNLNLPSLRNLACTTQCQWTRTVRNTLSQPATWNVTVEQQPGVTVTVAPSTFGFGENIFAHGFEDGAAPAGSQVLTITAQPSQALSSIRFVKVTFTEANDLAPPAHMWVAVQGAP
jgi:subtilisin family serine protease